MKNKLTVIAFNEINFDYIKFYANQGKLPNLKKMLAENALITTTSESEYKLLEPWIQWVTIQTGKSYAEHDVFRLGDITERKDLQQIFEKVEAKGKTVGAISPFNTDNRLKNPKFFVPDPWTETGANGSWLVRSLSTAVSQTVNDNAHSGLSLKSVFIILLSLLVYVPFSRYGHYLKLVKGVKQAGGKAIILDSLLADVFFSLKKKHQPDFSWLFLNSGAHIQHHYLFNSKAYKGEFKNPEWYCSAGHDPLLAILKEYDAVIGRAMKAGGKIVIATGLHQQPHKHLTHYWRLKRHEEFLSLIGLDYYDKVLPRMSRDFLIEFSSDSDAKIGQQLLESFYAQKDKSPMFTVDNRGKSLFVELTYSENIDNNFGVTYKNNKEIKNFKDYIAFVAIKNGEHNGTGYVLANFDLKLQQNRPLKELHDKILEAI